MTVRAVHHINCASMCPMIGKLLGQPVGLGRGRMVAHCLLIETERDGVVLVDTGLGTRDVEGHTHLSWMFRVIAAPALNPAETALAQITALGYAPADVRHVVLTHLDLDHAGGMSDFPNAKVHLHEREHAAAMAGTSLNERKRYLRDHWAHGPQWEVYAETGDTWRGLPAVTRLRGLDADIGLLPMHGHTRGHSAVIARKGERWLVHAGDTYFHHHTVDDGGSVPSGLAAFEWLMQIDPAARKASAAAMRQLHQSHADLDVFCAHDPKEYDALSSRRPSTT